MKSLINVTMPFLELIKTSYIKQRIGSSKRNGLRYAIFNPQSKGLFKSHYIGEWKNDVKEGIGKGVDR